MRTVFLVTLGGVMATTPSDQTVRDAAIEKCHPNNVNFSSMIDRLLHSNALIAERRRPNLLASRSI